MKRKHAVTGHRRLQKLLFFSLPPCLLGPSFSCGRRLLQVHSSLDRFLDSEGWRVASFGNESVAFDSEAVIALRGWLYNRKCPETDGLSRLPRWHGT